MNVSNFLSQEFMKSLILLEITTIMIVFKLVNSLVQYRPSESILILESLDKSLYFVLIFFFIFLIFYSLELRYDLLRYFFVLMSLLDIYQI
jgi:hypothetical protein